MALYLVTSFKGANLFAKLALIFLLIAFVLGWISYCTASWGRVVDDPTKPSKYFVGYGVWRVADNMYLNLNPSSASGNNAPKPLDYSYTDGWLLEWYGGFQACATIGFVCLNVGFFLIILFVFVGPCKSNGDMAFWNAINNFVGGVFWLIAVILFGVKFDSTYKSNKDASADIHYSFVFAIFTLALQLAAGIVLLLTNRGGGAVRSSK